MIKANKFDIKNAWFPAVTAVFAFICFLIVYWMCTARSHDPLYIWGLIFLLPSIVLACIAYAAGTEKMDSRTAVVLTAVLIPVFVIGSFFCLLIMGLSQTSATVTDAGRYERTMRIAQSSPKEQLAVFPKKIPKDAAHIDFYYQESSWQEYDQTVSLRFTANPETIDGYAAQAKALAIREETAGSRIFDRVGAAYIKDLPPDYTVYVIMNEGSHNQKICAVAVSKAKNEIIFYAYEMRW